MSTRNGIILRDGEQATIRFERRLPYPIERVWAALTEPAERAQWFGPTTLDAREGGEISMTAEGPPAPEEFRRMSGKIRVWDPPHIFEHEWDQTIIGQTIVRYELSRDGHETVLRFAQWYLSLKNAEGYIPGTHAYFDRLEALLAETALPDWVERYGEVAPDYGSTWKPAR